MLRIVQYILLISLVHGINIGHRIINSSQINKPIEFEISIDIDSDKILSVNLMSRTNINSNFIYTNMFEANFGYYKCILPASFTQNKFVQYYFIVELIDGGVFSLPDIFPQENSFTINLFNNEQNNIESNNDLFNIGDKVLILSPKRNEVIIDNSIMLAVSYFTFGHVDTSKTKIFMDDKNVTENIVISQSFLSGELPYTQDGEHSIKIIFVSKYGFEYEPVIWNFTINLPEQKKWMSENMEQSGRVNLYHTNSNVDDNVFSKDDLQINHFVDFRWLLVKSNLFITSLDNEYEQPRNRYGFEFSSQNIKIKIGDNYPLINDYALNGARVRGALIDFDFNYFNIQFLTGSMNKAIQGDPNASSMFLSEIIPATDNSYASIILNRNNYSFIRETSAFKLTFGRANETNHSFYFIKNKDNKFSVKNNILDAMIILPDSVLKNPGTNEFITSDGDNYFVKYVTLANNYRNILDNYSITLLDTNWAGDSPQDNIVFGSDLRLYLDDKRIEMKSGISFSMLNTNIWESITSASELDTLGTDIRNDGLFQGYIEIPDDIISYNEIFQLGINQTPIAPYDISSESIGIFDIINMPSLLYNFSSSFNYGNHILSYKYHSIGPSYNTLSNLNIEKNVSEQSLSDRFRLLNNKLFMYVKLFGKKNGLDLDIKNIIHNNGFEFSFSYYPGPNLPSLSAGISTAHRFNTIDYLYISEAGDTTDTRVDDRINNYNISVNDKFYILGKQTIFINVFVSDKKDVLSDNKKKYNSNYLSHSSFLTNIAFSLFTKLDDYWESNISYNSNYYSIGDNSSNLGLYLEQNINTYNFNITYHGNYLFKRINSGCSYVYGFGNEEFTFVNINSSLNQSIIKGMQIQWNLQIQKKWAKNRVFNNSIFTAKLLYSF